MSHADCQTHQQTDLNLTSLTPSELFSRKRRHRVGHTCRSQQPGPGDVNNLTICLPSGGQRIQHVQRKRKKKRVGEEQRDLTCQIGEGLAKIGCDFILATTEHGKLHVTRCLPRLCVQQWKNSAQERSRTLQQPTRARRRPGGWRLEARCRSKGVCSVGVKFKGFGVSGLGF